MLDDLPTWLVVIGLLPWWGRRAFELARDIDRYPTSAGGARSGERSRLPPR